MKKLLSGLLLDISDGSFSNPILEVSIDSIICDVLSVLIIVGLEGILGKLFIVTMVLLDSDTLLGSPAFEGNFGFHCLLG